MYLDARVPSKTIVLHFLIQGQSVGPSLENLMAWTGSLAGNLAKCLEPSLHLLTVLHRAFKVRVATLFSCWCPNTAFPSPVTEELFEKQDNKSKTRSVLF